MHDIIIRNADLVDGTGAERGAADIAVSNGIVTEIGAVDGRGVREIDADGRLVAPGWVDVHTHYDGQATWDPEMAPSSWHGATTVVMGSCGVGFAPARPDQHDFLIEVMEGVEDIPGTALHEGLSWGWESFPEYLDVLASMPRTLDVGALVPHTAIRAYVMGERCHDDESTPADIATMAALVAEGIGAGALGFSTSRTQLHRSVHGVVPGTAAAVDELLAIGQAMSAHGRSIYQFLDDDGGAREWGEAIAAMGLAVTYTLAQTNNDPTRYREFLDHAADAAARGLEIVPQTGARPVGMLYGLEGTFHPFLLRESYMAMYEDPLEERVRKLRDPDIRERIVSEPVHEMFSNPTSESFSNDYDRMYRLGDPVDYEPAESQSAEAIGAREGRRPAEVALDWLLEDNGQAMIYRPMSGYAEHNHDALREMMAHESTVSGLSDGGAHCGLICDASMPTYLLTHWARDRRRGDKLSIEHVVHKQTGRPAALFGLHDRGTIEPGKIADLNVIDFDGLNIGQPRMVRDLPAQGRRLIQTASGYDLTLKSGIVTYEHGDATGERPGRLVRRRG